MSENLKKAISATVAAAACIADAVVGWLVYAKALTELPQVLPGLIVPAVVAIMALVLGKPWKWPSSE